MFPLTQAQQDYVIQQVNATGAAAPIQFSFIGFNYFNGQTQQQQTHLGVFVNVPSAEYPTNYAVVTADHNWLTDDVAFTDTVAKLCGALMKKIG